MGHFRGKVNLDCLYHLTEIKWEIQTCQKVNLQYENKMNVQNKSDER